MARPESKRSSAWVWFAGGCLAAVVLLVLAVGALGVAGYRWAKSVERTQRDPEGRTAKAREILGSASLPEGYHAAVAVSVPFIADIAILTDEPPSADGEFRSFGQRGFLMVRMIRLGGDSQELADYFEGKTDDPSVLRRNHVNVDIKEVVSRGVVEPRDGLPRLLYLVQRGSLRMEGLSGRGLMSLILPQCGGGRQVIAIWFGKDPADGQPLDETALKGTCGDPAAISAFLSQFRLCDG